MAAARSEFAEHGFAGARVDRIAAAANCNKQAIYAYLGDKEALWNSVYSRMISDTVEAVPIDADDMPGYAGQLYDYFANDQSVLRLHFWYSLERPKDNREIDNAVRLATEAKLSAIASAQARGKIRPGIAPDLVLLLVLRLSVASTDPPEGNLSNAKHDAVRAAIVDAVRRITMPD
ncbi:TetR family transcriptional regulator [Croceicoccus sp. BE223]|uniref:TetR family transcriptional regulator n=1 Tax=Croceicoccus sp. BE223 TaxID=2817716 RepID=UPI002858D857|nr:TetR family transcriptional regulator [Croceicoccus sp. BE223]MDR7103733.1 AcrR family transcriptional regulator [Croceicoccus sp. BE223]